MVNAPEGLKSFGGQTLSVNVNIFTNTHWHDADAYL